MTEWTIDTLKEHLEKIITDRDTALTAAFVASQEAIDKAERRLNETLEGFPQEYTRKSEFENLEREINAIKNDHVQRRELYELKETQAQGRGGRVAAAAALGIIITLISITLGVMYANQLNHNDVSTQIAREAPWVSDRAGIELRLDKLDQKVSELKSELTIHKAENKVQFSNLEK